MTNSQNIHNPDSNLVSLPPRRASARYYTFKPQHNHFMVQFNYSAFFDKGGSWWYGPYETEEEAAAVVDLVWMYRAAYPNRMPTSRQIVAMQAVK